MFPSDGAKRRIIERNKYTPQKKANRMTIKHVASGVVTTTKKKGDLILTSSGVVRV